MSCLTLTRSCISLDFADHPESLQLLGEFALRVDFSLWSGRINKLGPRVSPSHPVVPTFSIAIFHVVELHLMLIEYGTRALYQSPA